MKINTSDYCPDGTYFTATDVQPDIQADGSVTLYNGRGTSRSWGRPQVTSTIVLDDCDLVAIHVGFSHKHRGGQGWYYYTTDGTETRRITWQQLPDEARQRILNAYEAKAPNWAKEPGKLRSEYVKPALRTMTSYKLVRMEADGRMVSLYDGRTEYRIGKRLAEKAESDHNGGWYSHPTQQQVTRLWDASSLVPSRCVIEGATYAMIKCEISGTIIEYENGKLSSTYLTPLEVVSTFTHQPQSVAA